MIAFWSAGSSLAHSVQDSSSVTTARLAFSSCSARLLDFIAKRPSRLLEQRCDRIGIVEQLAAIAYRGK